MRDKIQQPKWKINANKMNSCISGAVYTALKYSKQGGPENLDFLFD